MTKLPRNLSGRDVLAALEKIGFVFQKANRCMNRNIQYQVRLPLIVASLFMIALAASLHAQDPQAPVLLVTPNNDGAFALTNVEPVTSTETLGLPAHYWFAGNDGAITVPDGDGLNLNSFSIAVWVNPERGSLAEQKGLLVKSLESHEQPWYQWGLFLIDRPDAPASVAFYLSKQGQLHQATTSNVALYDGWTHLAATHDGGAMRLYVNGQRVAETTVPTMPMTVAPTPLVIGAYEHLARTPTYCYQGRMADIRVYDDCLDDQRVAALYGELRDRFPTPEPPAPTPAPREETQYEQGLNAALRSGPDLWGERLIADGGATYGGLEDLLQPLFNSTGETNTEYGPHTVLFGEDGGQPPFVVATADGHYLYADHTKSGKRIEIEVQTGDKWSAFAGGAPGASYPQLEGGYYPILITRHATDSGAHFLQTTFAARIPGLDHLVGLTEIKLTGASDSSAYRVRFHSRNIDPACLRAGPEASIGDGTITLSVAPDQPAYLLWSPQSPLPASCVIDAALVAQCKKELKAFWDERIGRQPFDVPEPLVMEATRNLLIQNLVLRWRYSLGSAVYHNSFYQPESSDACSLLAKYGYAAEARDGLEQLLEMTKGPGNYTNWEMGEKMSHAAEYYHLTGDAEFIHDNTPAWLKMISELSRQMRDDPRGLLEPQRFCGDQTYRSYTVFHQTVCWRGMRDLRIIWQQQGMDEAVTACGDADTVLRQALQIAIQENTDVLADGSVFIPGRLYEDVPVFDPIAATRDGSYWNLVMPYAFSSGFWPADSPTMDGISRFIHQHGGTFLGMIRFNYYPVAIGTYRSGGLPGYSTTGVDNVYMPGYIRFMADRDEAERLILSFYGSLAHGMTRGTFISGEGDTLGAYPDHNSRSSYGSYCSANNTSKLLALRQMLVRESFDSETGMPTGLYMAHATPRQWLEDGKTIRIKDAPTAFGPISCTIASHLADGYVAVRVVPPARSVPNPLRIRVRLPQPLKLTSIEGTVEGAVLLPDGETIELRQCVTDVEFRANVGR